MESCENIFPALPSENRSHIEEHNSDKLPSWISCIISLVSTLLRSLAEMCDAMDEATIVFIILPGTLSNEIGR